LFDIEFINETIEEGGEILQLGNITLGEVTEGFTASLSFWSIKDYQKQWLEAARRLLETDSPSAFISCMYDPEKANFINWWPVWRTSPFAVFQEQLFFMNQDSEDEEGKSLEVRFSLTNPYASVADWDSTHCEECRKTGVCHRPRLGKILPEQDVDYCPSEWCVQLGDIKDFVSRRIIDWAT